MTMRLRGTAVLAAIVGLAVVALPATGPVGGAGSRRGPGLARGLLGSGEYDARFD